MCRPHIGRVSRIWSSRTLAQYNIKNAPGRKTDAKDSQWIAELLVHGLVSASFITQFGCFDLMRSDRRISVGDKQSCQPALNMPAQPRWAPEPERGSAAK